ncbi:hypothetical protein GCM10009817_21040 [Terrabacter lapilli]|uniref:ABC transporter permease n=1 Tax=Terrabacter lapilli TaxID=436231 RepID=A0ABN2S475_9MICO
MTSASQQATTPATRAAVASRPKHRREHRPVLGALALLEAVRLARHPVLLAATGIGVLLTVQVLTDNSTQVSTDALGLPLVATSVGLGSMLAAFYLTRSFHRADEIVEASPTSTTARTGALCLTAVVPALVASVWFVLYYGARPAKVDAPEWMYGMFSHADIAAVLVGHSVISAVGATLLGVAAGRWWSFRGASAVLLLAVDAWTVGVLGFFSSGDDAPPEWFRWVRLLVPFGYFSSTTADNSSVVSLTGSPRWYAVWLLTLCALAVVAALLWRSEGATRRRVVRVGAVMLALSVLAYGLAVGGGLSHVVRTFPDGHSVVLVTR